jgi:hypothetical protein
VVESGLSSRETEQGAAVPEESPPPHVDLTNLDSVTEEERNAQIAWLWSDRRPLYNVYSPSLMFDYAPDFWKRSHWGWSVAGEGRVEVVLLAVQNIHSYTMLGWETGLKNEADNLRRNGCTRAQLMELVMFTQMYGGMRGLGHTYHAIGDMLAVWGDPPSLPSDHDALVWPDGWAADPEAFRSGIDHDARELTDDDRRRLTDWYERTIGYLPNSIAWGIKHHPEFVKVNRARWEVAIKTLPKQVVPYMMLRHHTITGSKDGLRESAALAKAWGITPELIVHGITCTAAYFTNFEGLYAVHDALEGLL